MEKVFIGRDCPECLKYKTYECDGKKSVCNVFSTMDFRMPMLFMLLESCPDEVNKLLQKFNVKIKEVNRYPYFQLVLN